MKTRHVLPPGRTVVLMVAVFSGFSFAQNASVAAPSSQSSPTQVTELAKFFQEYFEERLRDDPEFATSVGRHEYDDRWSDLSKQGCEQRRSHLSQRLQQLNGFGTNEQSEQDRLSVNLLRYDLRSQLESFDLEMYLLRVGQMFGAHNRVYMTVDRMPARSVRDGENVIARLRAIPAYVDQNISVMNEAIARGWTQPKIVVELVIEQLTKQVAQDAATTPLLEFLKKMPGNIPEEERARLKKEAAEAFENDFRPSWRMAGIHAKRLPPESAARHWHQQLARRT